MQELWANQEIERLNAEVKRLSEKTMNLKYAQIREKVGTKMITKGQVRDWMLAEVSASDAYYDSAGEINSTLLAESAAEHFNQLAWLEDETHFVWDAAVEVADVF